MILVVFIYQPLSRAALTRNRHRSARNGIKRYVSATVARVGNRLKFQHHSSPRDWEVMTVAIKQRAHELIEALPDDATWQDLLYALELRGDVEAGLADAKAGRVTDTEDLRREYGLRR